MNEWLTADRPAGADIYTRMLEAFLRYKSAYFHPEYPDDWLRERLQRFLPELPFYATDNCVLRPVWKQDYLYMEMILNFGRPSFQELVHMVVTGYEMASRAGLPLYLEAYEAGRHRNIGRVTEQELQFPYLNPHAQDPWDGFDRGAGLEEPQRQLLAAVGGSLPDVEVATTPFYGYVYFEHERPEAMDILAAVSSRCRVLHVSSSSRALTGQLQQQLAAGRRSGQVGATRVNYVTTIPNRAALDKLRALAGEPRRHHVLLRGRLYDLSESS